MAYQELMDVQRASNAAFAQLADAIRSTMQGTRFEHVSFHHDVVYIPEMAEAIEDEGFTERFFTNVERRYCNRFIRHWAKAEHFASAFGIKEAVMKTLDAWPDWLTEIEVYHRSSGASEVNLTGSALEMQKAQGIERLQVSASHSGNIAVGTCLGFWRRKLYYAT